MLVIKETTLEDLDNIIHLWANGEVMKYVGFPDGIHQSMEQMVNWLKWALNKPNRMHYSIYEDGKYCGETFYNVDDKYAALDIKLMPECMGKGIGTESLSFAISKAFLEGKAQYVYVDPHIDNSAAWSLYRKLGFLEKSIPDNIEAGPTYQELSAKKWFSR